MRHFSRSQNFDHPFFQGFGRDTVRPAEQFVLYGRVLARESEQADLRRAVTPQVVLTAISCIPCL